MDVDAVRYSSLGSRLDCCSTGFGLGRGWATHNTQQAAAAVIATFVGAPRFFRFQTVRADPGMMIMVICNMVAVMVVVVMILMAIVLVMVTIDDDVYRPLLCDEAFGETAQHPRATRLSGICLQSCSADHSNSSKEVPWYVCTSFS